MTGNSDRSRIDILQEMTRVVRQIILLDALEQMLQVAKKDNALDFLPLIKSIANYTKAQIATGTSLQPELNPIFLSLVALLEQKERELSSQSDRHDRQ